jgi:putative DNA primase/helicase
VSGAADKKNTESDTRGSAAAETPPHAPGDDRPRDLNPEAADRNGQAAPDIRDVAVAAMAARLNVFPPREDGSKAPDGKWERFQTERTNARDLLRWYGPRGKPPRRHGLGVVCGGVSGDLEVLEFDARGEAYETFKETARAAGLGDLIDRLEEGYLERSPSGGVHWLYRVDLQPGVKPEGNQKLAQRYKTEAECTEQDRQAAEDARAKGKSYRPPVVTLIETRGEGGYIILAPSGGPVHPSGDPYVLLGGGFATIPLLTPDDRESLLTHARSFDALVGPDDGPRCEAEARRAAGDDWPDTVKTWDDFNARTTWPDVLPAGWTLDHREGDTEYWRRPGKDKGHGATVNRNGSDRLYVFTTSTEFAAGKPYSRFDAYVLLEHKGVVREAVKALSQAGYGQFKTWVERAGGAWEREVRQNPCPRGVRLARPGDEPPRRAKAGGGPAAQRPPVAGGFVGSVGSSTLISPEFSGGFKPLKGDLLEVHPLPQALIPLPFRGWLTDIATRGCFPLEYPTAAALVALSSLVGRNLAIRPKRQDSWTVVPNLWGGIIGPPGLQKSPAVDEALTPLKRLVAEAMEAHAAAERTALEDAAIAEARASAAKKGLLAAAKRGAPESELRELVAASKAAEVEAPAARRYMVNDATVEKLGELLRENPRGLLQYRDEMSGWLRSMDRPGHESDRGFYLETWMGNGSYTFDRIGRGTVHVDALCLSVFGTIQPGPLARYLKGAAAGEDADGFVPRFQLLVYPDPPDRFVNVDRWPDTRAKNDAFEVFRWVDSLDPAAAGAELDEDRGLSFVRFDPAAQGLFDAWREGLENRLRGGAESALMAGHLAKYRSLMPSLALLLHLIDSVGQPTLSAVTFPAAEAAAAWCEFLESHARRAYQSALDGDPETAARLGERIKASLPNPFTFRHVANKGWAGLDTVEDVRRTVGFLEDRNWVKVVTKPPGPSGGRPSEEVWVHPALLSGEGGAS